MDKAIGKRWVKALRSGKYKQGNAGVMKLGGCYCCLGVLREVIKSKDTSKFYLTFEETATCNLRTPKGTILKDPTNESYEIVSTLATLNDHGIVIDGKFERFTFEEIADVIEFEMENL